MGSWADALTSGEVSPQANKASPASLMFMAATQSAAVLLAPLEGTVSCERFPSSLFGLRATAAKATALNIRLAITDFRPKAQRKGSSCPATVWQRMLCIEKRGGAYVEGNYRSWSRIGFTVCRRGFCPELTSGSSTRKTTRIHIQDCSSISPRFSRVHAGLGISRWFLVRGHGPEGPFVRS